MSLLLIDDVGTLWPGESRQIRASFDSPFSGGEFIEYAVKNLGFVAINNYGRSCQVRVRPSFVGERSIATLQEWLSRSRIERVALTSFRQAWSDELLLAKDFEDRLAGILASRDPGQSHEFLSRPLPDTARHKEPLLGELAVSWPNLVNEYRTDILVELLRTAFTNQHVVVKRLPDRDKLLFQEIGDRMYARYENWRTCAIGAPIEEQPDRAFGRWVAHFYRETTDATRPQIDAVDAIIRCPEEGRFRRRYRRFIFPLPATATGQLLVGGSVNDPVVDLRIPGR